MTRFDGALLAVACLIGAVAAIAGATDVLVLTIAAAVFRLTWIIREALSQMR